MEKKNKALRGALPDNYFTRLGLEASKLVALIDSINNIDTVTDREEDVVGRVYEYFLGKFAATEGKGGGELDLKADFIMANPPFNLKAWRGGEELADDPRWAGHEVPPAGNANYG